VVPHRDCPENGYFEHYVIREHSYSFLKCVCGVVLGGSRTEAEIDRLMRTKVWPVIRRA